MQPEPRRSAPRFAAILSIVLAPAAAWAQSDPRGDLVRTDGASEPYSLTAEDALWAARMLVGESGGQDDTDNAAVLWCMIHSYMIRPVRELYPTFKDFVRAYCTPLQRNLKSKGAIERHKKRGTPMVEVSPGKWQLVRHVELQERSWEKLPAGARALVERVFGGGERSACGNATQFCSTAVYFHDRQDRRPDDEELVRFTKAYAEEKGWIWIPVEGADLRENAFFEEKRFESLPEGVVTVRADHK